MLTIQTDKVCYVIVKSRAFETKVEVVEDDPGSNPSDGSMREVLEDYADDPTFQEVKTFIEDMNDDEQTELVALMWLGRGDYDKDEWDRALADARRERVHPTWEYVLGTPLACDYLEEGLNAFDLTCEDFEMGRM